MKVKSKKYLSVLLAVVLCATSILAWGISNAKAASADVVAISESAGYEEGAYAEWAPVTGADGYIAYVSADKQNWTKIDDMLIREYADYWRADTVGLAAGTYYIKVAAVKVGSGDAITTLSEAVTGALTVTNYDRSGFAFSQDSPLKDASGAYKSDGTLKPGAQVIYVTKDTAKTCTAKVNGATVTGLQAILDAKQKKNTSNDILDIRIIGCVRDTDLDKMSSSAEGLQIKGNAAETPMNITIEGIGEDAAIHGFGMQITNSGNVELRNFGVLDFMDDGISIQNDNCNLWVHDLDLLYGQAGSSSDQKKGDGSIDLKDQSNYVTISYVHFVDSGKSSLCGMKKETEYFVTYHHNWFDHSDSRHPRIRTGSIHVYNNYYDGNAKYGVGVTYSGEAFVEANYFRNCKYPMLISMQGSDVGSGDKGDGTFSDEDGGIIKAYNNKIEGAKALVYANTANGATPASATEFDAYLATTRSEQVPSTYVAKQGGKVYDNFDTKKDLGVKESAIDSPEDVERIVTAKAGRLNGGDLNWTFDDSTEDTNDKVIAELKSQVVNYTSPVKSIGGLAKTGVTVPDETASSGQETSAGSESSSGTGSSSGSENESTGSGSAVTGTKHELDTIKDSAGDESFFKVYRTDNAETKHVQSDMSASYNGKTYTGKPLKWESKTVIEFTVKTKAKVVLILDSAASKVNVDGNGKDTTGGILEIEVEAGTHKITRSKGSAFFYIAVTEEEGQKPSDATTPTDQTQPSTDQTQPSTDQTQPSTDQTQPSTDPTTPVDPTPSGSGSTGIVTNLSKLKDSDFKNVVYVAPAQSAVSRATVPAGTPSGAGTKESPLDLETAIAQAQQGQAIILMDGTYAYDHQITIEVGNDGTASAYKVLRAADGAKVTLDFSSQSYNMSDTSLNARGLQMDANYWYVNGITVYGAADNGIFISGSNNIVERCILQANRDTGLQISRRVSALSDMKDWPANNQIINCTSFDNCDTKSGENADGFAAKLTCGNGNVFDGCIAYSNSDDGWDLYAKEATGSIGVVTIRNCIAFNNGTLTNGSSEANGDMNGFKLGGSNGKVPTPHVVENCLAFNNGKHGFTDNGNGAALTLTNCSAYNNAQSNFAFDRTNGGKFSNLVSYATGSTADKFVGTLTNSIYFTSAKKHSYTGTTPLTVAKGDKVGTQVTMSNSMFVSMTAPSGTSLTIDKDFRNADGTINVHQFLELLDSENVTYGTKFGTSAAAIVDVKADVKENTPNPPVDPTQPSESESSSESASNPQESESASKPQESESASKPQESESGNKPSENETTAPQETPAESGSGSGAGNSDTNAGVNTGDANMLLMWMAVVLLSGIGVVYLSKKKDSSDEA